MRACKKNSVYQINKECINADGARALFMDIDNTVKNEDFSILTVQNHCGIRFDKQKSSF